MGLGLPDGGHLTHGYYVRKNILWLSSLDAALCPRNDLTYCRYRLPKRR